MRGFGNVKVQKKRIHNIRYESKVVYDDGDDDDDDDDQCGLAG